MKWKMKNQPMSNRRVQIILKTPPHSDKQRLIVNAFNIPGLLEMWVCAGSKAGKTYAMSAAFSMQLPISDQALYRWVAPIYTQSKIGFNYVKRILPGPPYVKANESNLEIAMPHNDSKIQFFHGQNPESQEGEATAGTALDEASKLKEEVYYSAKTTTGVTKGPILAFSTPRGDNWFKRKCDDALEEMKRAKREKRRPTKIFIHMPSTDNPFFSREIMEDARRTMPDRLFRQYYLAEFTGTGTIFTNLHNCWLTDFIETDSDNFQWYAEGCEFDDVVIGADWARVNDYTVFTASAPKTREVIGIWRMKGVPYPAQIRRLINFSNNFKSVLTVWHDKTGVGIALDDMLGQTELPFRGITFSNSTKNEMMVKLILAFEEVSYHIPYIDKLSSELNDLEVKTTALGLPSYAAPDGGHDDIVMSLALSHVAMLQHVERDYGIIDF